MSRRDALRLMASLETQVKPALQGNDVVLCAKNRERGVALRGRRLKPALLKSAELRPSGLVVHRIRARVKQKPRRDHGEA
jgi:hypothetical protein